MLTYNITGLIIKNLKTELCRSITNGISCTSLLDVFLTKLHTRDEYEFYGCEHVTSSQGKPFLMTQIKGRYLICGSDQGISIYDIRKKMINVKNIPADGIIEIQYLSHGKLAICNRSQQLAICDLYNSYKLTVLHNGQPFTNKSIISKYHNKTFLTLFDDNYIIVYDYIKAIQVNKLKAPHRVVNLILGKGNVKYAATTEDYVHKYSSELKQLNVIIVGSRVLNMVSFGSKLVIAVKEKLSVYSTNLLELLTTIDIKTVPTCLIKLKSKYIVIGDEDGYITFYNIQDNYNSFCRKAYTTAVSSIIQLEDGRLITCSEKSYYLKFWK
jgi:hypothetical protein